MYISDVSENIRNLFEKLESKEIKDKLEFLIYVIDSIYNGHINEKNSANPSLEEDDIEIFSFEDIGLENKMCSDLVEFLLSLHDNRDNIMYDNGAIIGIDYNGCNDIIIKFENLTFEEKLDVIAELMIEYDNDTYFNNDLKMSILKLNVSGYDIAEDIKKYKSRI